jgi:AcrR family transcriptional regulator
MSFTGTRNYFDPAGLVSERSLCYSTAMPRPQVHDREAILDAAEALAVRGGPKAVTVRAVSELSGISNGAIYHAFGSMGGLVGRAWARAARRFLSLQRRAVDAKLQTAGGAVCAVVAAANTVAVFSEQYPASAQLLIGTRREDLISDAPAQVQAELLALDDELRDLLIRLSGAVFHRKDGAAVAIIEDCVVGLPSGLMFRRPVPPTADARRRLAAAVEALLSVGPPPPRRRAK